eukprot:Gb_39470 [translate_table: standard]
MAGSSSLLPILRRISAPIMGANKYQAVAALQSRLFSVSSVPPQGFPQAGWIKPVNGVPRLVGVQVYKSGNPATNSRNFAKAPKDMSEDDEDDDDDDEDDDGDDDVEEGKGKSHSADDDDEVDDDDLIDLTDEY